VAFNRCDSGWQTIAGTSRRGKPRWVRAQRIAVLIWSNCRKRTNTKDNPSERSDCSLSAANKHQCQCRLRFGRRLNRSDPPIDQDNCSDHNTFGLGNRRNRSSPDHTVRIWIIVSIVRVARRVIVITVEPGGSGVAHERPRGFRRRSESHSHRMAQGTAPTAPGRDHAHTDIFKFEIFRQHR
jgi:hypothetical protein